MSYTSSLKPASLDGRLAIWSGETVPGASSSFCRPWPMLTVPAGRRSTFAMRGTFPFLTLLAVYFNHVKNLARKCSGASGRAGSKSENSVVRVPPKSDRGVSILSKMYCTTCSRS